MANSSTGNVAIGNNTGRVANGLSQNCVYLGSNAQSSGLFDNSMALGASSLTTANDQVRIGNSSVNSIGGIPAWTTLSDGRFKKEIKENVPGLSFIKTLRPITYELDQQAIKLWQKSIFTNSGSKEVITPSDLVQTGFIAQEVEASAHALGFDFSGVDAPQNDQSQYGLRYAAFVVPLVKAVQEQQVIIDILQSEKINLAEQFTTLQTELHQIKQILSELTQ